MKEIRRYDINEDWAHAGIIQAGDYCFINYCARNIGGTIEEQIDGAFDEMEERLALVGLTLENVVQMNCLFKNIWDIPVMENVISVCWLMLKPLILLTFAPVSGIICTRVSVK